MKWSGTVAEGARSCSSSDDVIPAPWLHASLNLDPLDPSLATQGVTGPRPQGWQRVDWSPEVVAGRIVAVKGEPVDPVPVVVGWFGDTTEVVAMEWLREKFGLENGATVTLELDAAPQPVGGGTVALVARRADGGARDEAWRWVRQRWEALTDIPVYVGYDDAIGPYNNSRARNRAAALAGDWDTAVIFDADSFCGIDQVEQGLALAAETGLHSICFRRFRYLTEAGSRTVMDGYRGSWERLVRKSFLGGCSSMLVVPRAAWDAVGGMDEGFVGWGEEDVAFSVALQTLNPHREAKPGEDLQQLRAGFRRIAGDCWHLHHPEQPEAQERMRSDVFRRNVARRERYVEAAHQPEKMRALLAELGVLR